MAAAAATEQLASPPPATGFGLPRLIPSLPMNVFNSLNPFAASETSKPGQETKEVSPAPDAGSAFFKRPLFGTILSRPAAAAGTAADGSPSHKRTESLTVMFAEPVGTDSDDASREGSVSNEAQRRQRSRPKPKTTFSICHPPPASLTRHKLHRTPRSLLQLHKRSANGRPVPAYDVIPSANFSARLTKQIIKTYKTKHGLCYNDLVILRAEKYYAEDHEEEQESQDIMALICGGRGNEIAASGRAKICMSNGEEWEATPHTSGGYEFCTVDDHGLNITVRWVPKRIKDSKQGTTRRFNFSTIAQNTRRHPVIASLSDTGLDVCDTYKVPDPSISTPLSTPVQSDSILMQAMEDEDLPTKDECITDERLRSIIAVTAIYVAFKEGWSPYFKYDDKDAAAAQRSGGSPQKDLLTTPVSTPPGSPMQPALEKRGSIRSIGSGLIRRSSMLSKSHRDSTASIDSAASADTTSASKTGRTRSDSNSTVLVHRAASNRRRNNQQATWRPDLLHVQDTVPEASGEHLPRPDKSETNAKPMRRQGIRKQSIAEDTEDTDEEDDDDDDEEQETSTGDKKDDKSSAATSNAADPPLKVSPSASNKRSTTTRKSGRWRRLFCMS